MSFVLLSNGTALEWFVSRRAALRAAARSSPEEELCLAEEDADGHIEVLLEPDALLEELVELQAQDLVDLDEPGAEGPTPVYQGPNGGAHAGPPQASAPASAPHVHAPEPCAPFPGAGSSAPTFAVVDVSNVLRAGQSRVSPDGAVARLKAVVQLLEEQHLTPVLICGGASRALTRLSAGRLAVSLGLAPEQVHDVVGGHPADLQILAAAQALGGVVVSNDQFRQHRAIHPWIAERRIGFLPLPGGVVVLVRGDGVPLQPGQQARDVRP